MISLKDFVTETLRQVIDGVKAAQENAEKTGARVSGKNITCWKNQGMVLYDASTDQLATQIEFDVAVTTSDSGRGQAGVGIFVGGLGVGTKAETATASQSISRIKFSVPILLPTH